jgi:hypothetical protein
MYAKTPTSKPPSEKNENILRKMIVGNIKNVKKKMVLFFVIISLADKMGTVISCNNYTDFRP